jgi:uncharacterized protein YcgL (UPF0745 family)
MTESDLMLCQVYRSERRAGAYLYTVRSDGLSRVPAVLLESFGRATPALTFRLYAGRRLAQADAAVVLAAIRDKGFYLQLPPAVANDDSECLHAD